MHFEQNVNLAGFTTFHIYSLARYFTRFSSIEMLDEVVRTAAGMSLPNMFVLGGGSNILMTRDYNGLVIKNEIGGIELTGEDGDYIYLKAGGGVNWHSFVLYCVKHNYAGIENLSLIPGSVGASPMQNIGAYGVEIKDVFYQLEAFHIHDKKTQLFSLNDCAFGYRDSVFKNKYKNQFVITSVTFRLNKKANINASYGAISSELEKMGITNPSIQDVSQAVINIRTSKLPDPDLIGNAGSFFKNPLIPSSQFNDLKKEFPDMVAYPVSSMEVKLAAGWLIEQCGWKGFRKGDAGCYPKQALVLVNYGYASGKEIYDLSEQVIDSVRLKFGVQLEREVNIY